MGVRHLAEAIVLRLRLTSLAEEKTGNLGCALRVGGPSQIWLNRELEVPISQEPDKPETDEVSDKKLEDVSGGALSVGKSKDKYEREADEVTEEQLEGVAGGATADTALQKTSLTKPVDKASAPLMDTVNEGNTMGSAELDLTRTTDHD